MTPPQGQYEVTFTRGFKDGLRGLPKEVYPIVDRQITSLSMDPYAKNPNATRMKNAPNTFRMRIGIHVRMLYRVFGHAKRVEIKGIGTREHIYEHTGGGATALLPTEVDALLAEIRRASRPSVREQTIGVESATTQGDLQVTVEHLPWISEDELFLLHVPSGLWPAIIRSGSIDRLKAVAIDDDVKSLIEDYWTNPLSSQVEKLYALSEGQGAQSIAHQPLSHFLIALDPEQRQALEKIKLDGPYLLKGSAGTGKSLVGLYHIRDQITARAGESMFDSQQATYGVITYTNTLVDANDALLKNISPASAHPGICCSTLDKIAYHLAGKTLGRTPNALNLDGISLWIRQYVVPDLPAETVALMERLGYDYVAEEIEQVIFGNGLAKAEDYLQVERKGRKRGLREDERIAIWDVSNRLSLLFQTRKVQSFEQWRSLALAYLKSHPDYPRFAVLFVDEAQDFSKMARQLCLELVGDPRHLVLAADTGQSIYTVPVSWLQSDPRLDFRRRRPIMLERSYRATREISVAIAPLRADPGDDDDRSTNARPVFSGSRPRWIDAPAEDHAAVVCDEILKLVGRATNPLNAGQIAIIVRDSIAAHRYLSALVARGISAMAIAKGEPLRIDGKDVHIVTAHSSKGLGFPVVFVPEVNAGVYPPRYLIDRAKDSLQRDQVEEKEQRLLYVALSRASYSLCMIIDPAQPSPFLTQFDRAAHWS